ncbi:MAG: anaerobic ribonucleoside-triphosphate reductase activating protein [Candidatus Uhrbacteria bacterium]
MLIDGLQKLSLLDYPGKIAAVIFTFGCNFRCGFCHNPRLVCPELRDVAANIPEGTVMEFLQSRKKFLEGVAITGGEPTIQADLPDFIKKVKALGYLIKLDTNGTNSRVLGHLLEEKLLDFVAMDIKNSPANYEKTVGRDVDLAEIRKSIALIKESGVDYEFRSTIAEGLHEPVDILAMAEMIAGAKKYVLQPFVSRNELVDADFVGRRSFEDGAIREIASQCEQSVQKCEVRSYE